jgi:hypothetical protein
MMSRTLGWTHRRFTAALLGLVLLRALIPAGFMLGAEAGHPFEITFCRTYGPAVAPPISRTAGAIAGIDRTDPARSANHGADDSPACPFGCAGPAAPALSPQGLSEEPIARTAVAAVERATLSSVETSRAHRPRGPPALQIA